MLVGSPPPMHVLAAPTWTMGKKEGKGGDEIGEKRRKRHEIGRESCWGYGGGEQKGGGGRGEVIGLVKMRNCTYEILKKK